MYFSFQVFDENFVTIRDKIWVTVEDKFRATVFSGVIILCMWK